MVQGLTRMADIYGAARDLVAALVAVVHASRNFDQGAFACAVFADQRVDFSRLHFKVNAFERIDAGEALVNVL